MINALTHSFVWVLDQAEALDFYVGKLGLEVNTDADLEFMRWLTVNVPGHPEHEIVLMVPAPPALDPDAAEQVRALLGKGAGSGFIFTTDDCWATYEELRANGVEFTEEPVERFYGIDVGLRDPFGNPLRITQPAEEMGEPPSTMA
jgi:catechol 2,3-dioxygenase-like lactoylglutathione lyase family enzyme